MSLLADIAAGETGTADVLFLVAVILAVVAALFAYATWAETTKLSAPLGWLALAALALGLLLL